MRRRQAQGVLDTREALGYRAHMAALVRCGATLLALVLALVVTSCGSGDDCAGFISVNATPPACEMLAEEFGCSSFDAAGDNCGLVACARCDGL